MNITFSHFSDFEKYLSSLGYFTMKPGQERMAKALKALNLLPLPYVAVQIVGTNGKGSTSSFLSFLAREYGLNTGLFTSPHLAFLDERILFNGKFVPRKVWLHCAERVYNTNSDLSYFEFVTVLSALIFTELRADIVFFEAGLGGKFDATTALLNQAVVFTPFDLDHTHILGNTLKEIAIDKSQAINIHTKFAVTAQQELEANEELLKTAKNYSVPLYTVENPLPDYNTTLLGTHQKDNARLALTAWRLIRKELLPEAMTTQLENKPHPQLEENALKKTFIPARLQVIESEDSPFKNKKIILDGAHNVHAVRTLYNALKDLSLFPDTVIFSCLKDKNVDEMLSLLIDIAQLNENCEILIAPIYDNPRAFTPVELAHELDDFEEYDETGKSQKINLKCVSYDDFNDCLNTLNTEEKQTVLIFGSLYLLGQFYSLYPKFLMLGEINEQ